MQTGDQSARFASQEELRRMFTSWERGICRDLWAGPTRAGCEHHRGGNDEVLELSAALLAGHSPRSHHKPTHASLPAAEGLRQ